jgi:hypothetical protein
LAVVGGRELAPADDPPNHAPEEIVNTKIARTTAVGEYRVLGWNEPCMAPR